MTILVLGGGGMAGHVMATYFSEHGHVVDTVASRTKFDERTHLLDVRDVQKFTRLLADNRYDVVINCVASLVQQSEAQKDVATYLNAYLPHFLEHYYADTKVKIIHISSDGVFSGQKAAYDEQALYDEQGFYGRSKALGEIINDKDLTIRTSIIGPDMRDDAPGLFNWFYKQSGTISGYENIYWQGVTTMVLAEFIDKAMAQNLTGVYHLVPKDHISKFELLQLCKRIFNRKDISIQPDGSRNFKRNLANTRTDIDFAIPSYIDMIQKMKQWTDSHTALYPHYLRSQA